MNLSGKRYSEVPDTSVARNFLINEGGWLEEVLDNVPTGKRIIYDHTGLGAFYLVQEDQTLGGPFSHHDMFFRRLSGLNLDQNSWIFRL